MQATLCKTTAAFQTSHLIFILWVHRKIADMIQSSLIHTTNAGDLNAGMYAPIPIEKDSFNQKQPHEY